MALQVLSKQGAPQSSTAIPREKRLRSNAEHVVTLNSPQVKDGSHQTVGGSRQWLGPSRLLLKSDFETLGIQNDQQIE
jgi:hypothetical protein